MVLIRGVKWMYAAAGSGIAISLYNYLQPEKRLVQASWTTNFEPSVKWDFNWDKRGDWSTVIKPAKNEEDPKEQNRINKEKEKKPTVTRHIFLIRHGQYHDKATEDKDKKLTPLGRKQAENVGQRLKELGYNYTSLTSSTMIRAIETADIIHKYLPDLPTARDDLLQEGAPIPPEPDSIFYQPEPKEVYTDGPRIEAAFRKYFHRADASQKSNSYEIIVCHGNVIRYFFCRALQFPPEAWLRLGLHHCSITWIVLPPSGRVGVYAYGDFGFHPKEEVTDV